MLCRSHFDIMLRKLQSIIRQLSVFISDSIYVAERKRKQLEKSKSEEKFDLIKKDKTQNKRKKNCSFLNLADGLTILFLSIVIHCWFGELVFNKKLRESFLEVFLVVSKTF